MLDVFEPERLESVLLPGVADAYQGPSAAVAAVLRPGHDGPEMLFIERAAKEGDPWSGQIAFPGGRTDPGDDHSHATASRETLEEVGFDLSRTTPLGRLADQQGGPRGTRQTLRVSPHVCWFDGDRPSLELNHEVADVLWVPVVHIADEARHVDYEYPPLGSQTWPGVQLDATRVLWGLTLRMTEDLFSRVGHPLGLRSPGR
ncbi:MAG: CoA pyrophosphatase [Actinomycetota bacterium]|jgi:8-oxo-dGTP pyrophosphatase MutT (NUDIX family)|nr:CoA pyrophosphatase [Actinomycetota bacterium]